MSMAKISFCTSLAWHCEGAEVKMWRPSNVLIPYIFLNISHARQGHLHFMGIKLAEAYLNTQSLEANHLSTVMPLRRWFSDRGQEAAEWWVVRFK
jgi:hypothetical protein